MAEETPPEAPEMPPEAPPTELAAASSSVAADEVEILFGGADACVQQQKTA